MANPLASDDPPRGLRDGVSLIEAVLVLLLLSIVITGGWTVVAGNRSAAMSASLRAEALELVRTTGWILGEEAAGGNPGTDWWIAGSDTLLLRAFRGLALPKGPWTGGGKISVCFRGIRNPNPEKDSVLLLGPGGDWTAHALIDRVPGERGCGGMEDARSEIWTMAPEPGSALLARLFERGSYHLADGALRYRRGNGGRQPITPSRLEEGHLMDTRTPNGFSWWLTVSSPVSSLDSVVWRGAGW